MLAHEALEDCADWLEKGVVRKALRAAHDAVHCSLVVLLHSEFGREHYPFKRRKEIGEFIKSHAPGEAVNFANDPNNLLWIMATKPMVDDQATKDLLPEAPDVSELINIRHSIEHPKPGETAWELTKCLAAIRAGAEFASQALQLTKSTDGAGLDAQLDRIKRLAAANIPD